MSDEADRPPPTSELILYRTEDSRTRIEVRIGGDSVWLTQVQMASLYQVSAKTVSEHLGNVFDDGECEPERTVRKFRTVQVEGGREVRRLLDHYSLEAILAVGFRVRSSRGTQFRQWASERLQEYLVKGFALDDERLKRGSTDGYYEELYARIRDIRASEREFWRKVLDIYATRCSGRKGACTESLAIVALETAFSRLASPAGEPVLNASERSEEFAVHPLAWKQTVLFGRLCRTRSHDDRSRLNFPAPRSPASPLRRTLALSCGSTRVRFFRV